MARVALNKDYFENTIALAQQHLKIGLLERLIFKNIIGLPQISICLGKRLQKKQNFPVRETFD